MKMSKYFALGPIALTFVLAAVGTPSAPSTFSFSDDAAGKTLTILDGSRGVLTFRYGDQLKPGVDPKQVRSGYIHPLFGLDGEVLTDDAPADHLHHHGLFWTWPIIRTRGIKTGTWEPATPPTRQHFVRWTEREVRDGQAALGIESVWKFDENEIVARERVRVVVQPQGDLGRFIDITVGIEPVGGSLEFQGSQDAGKGYGGLCFRGAPQFKGAALTTDLGPQKEDAVNTAFKWADVSIPKGGIAIFVPPDHPGFPIPWLIRNSYAGILNPSWPGLKSAVVEAGKSVTLRYRLFIHRGDAAAARVAENYAARAAPPAGSAAYTKDQEYLFDLIKSRRTIRAFKDTPVPEEHLLKILDMARMAPTSGNQQPWKFLVVRDRKKLEALKKEAAGWYLAAAEKRQAMTEDERTALSARMAATMDRVLSAPVYVACLTDSQSAYPPDNRHDGPLAVALLMITARALGYGTGYYTTFFPEDKMRGFLGIPERYNLLCFTPIGVPVEWPAAPPKKPLADFLVFDSFDRQ